MLKPEKSHYRNSIFHLNYSRFQKKDAEKISYATREKHFSHTSSEALAIFPTRGENGLFPVWREIQSERILALRISSRSYQTARLCCYCIGSLNLSLDLQRKITCFIRGEQAIVILCNCSTRLRLVLQTSHLLANARFPHQENKQLLFYSFDYCCRFSRASNFTLAK